MPDLEKMAAGYRSEGYSQFLAEARVCQDIVLKAIAESPLSRNVTIKGGVVMRSITGNVRRATRDIDFDLIRYSIDEASIRTFMDKLNCLEGISIDISGPVEELSQHEYRGKRIRISIHDDHGSTFRSKIDLGVHKNIQIDQEEYCFDVCLDDDGASLLINSKEQIFAEKLRALVKLGTFSGRVKDIFDLCFLSESVDRKGLLKCLHTFILDDPEMWENDMQAVISRISKIFSDKEFIRTVESSGRDNWLGIRASIAFKKILTLLNSLPDR